MKWMAITFIVIVIGLVFIFLTTLHSPRMDLPAPTPDVDWPDDGKIPEPSHIPAPGGGPQSEVDWLLGKMEIGTIAFNTPSTMDINDSSNIQLLLSYSQTIEKLKKSILEEGEKMAATIKISDRMEARLTGYMFRITAITPETQAVSKNQNTEWRWEIHPKKEGEHNLHLTLTALLEVYGYSTPRVIRTFDKTIQVTVSGQQKITGFFETNWQWLWAAILVPVAGWLWKRKRRKEKEPKMVKISVGDDDEPEQ